MDYKKIVKSRKLRIKILDFLSFIPDKMMLKIQYRIKMGRKLNLKNPQRYTEKLQWYKLYYKNPAMKSCVDKYEVRKYVTEKGYSRILNELYGIYNSPEEIDFEKLPNSFVIKDTLGGGGNSVILVKDKLKLDIEETKKQMNAWLKDVSRKSPGREWIYDNQKHRIIIEKLLIAENKEDLPDYKFFCFNGKPYCIYMMENYTLHHEKGVLGFLDTDFKLLPYYREDFKAMRNSPQKPENFEEMLK